MTAFAKEVATSPYVTSLDYGGLLRSVSEYRKFGTQRMAAGTIISGEISPVDHISLGKALEGNDGEFVLDQLAVVLHIRADTTVGPDVPPPGTEMRLSIPVWAGRSGTAPGAYAELLEGLRASVPVGARVMALVQAPVPDGRFPIADYYSTVFAADGAAGLVSLGSGEPSDVVLGAASLAELIDDAELSLRSP